MKGMGMESDASSMGFEIQRLRKSVRTAQLLTMLLGLLVLALLIALAAVGASQHKKISNLQSDVGGSDVYLGAHSSLRNREGATYAGSLFRGSGFWASRALLPGDHLAPAPSLSGPIDELLGLSHSLTAILFIFFVFSIFVSTALE